MLCESSFPTLQASCNAVLLLRDRPRAEEYASKDACGTASYALAAIIASAASLQSAAQGQRQLSFLVSLTHGLILDSA